MDQETKKDETQTPNFSLAKVNEDNLLELIEDEKGNDDSIEKEKLIDTSKYKIKYSEIINNIRDNINNCNNNEFLCNILLMPFNVDLEKKLNTLCLLSYYYQKKENCECIYAINNKYEKYSNYLNSIDQSLNLKVFFRTAYFLQKQKNYFYAYKYIRKCNELILKLKLQNEVIKQVNEYFKNIKKDFVISVNEKKYLFQNEDIFTTEKEKELLDLINSIISLKNNLDSDEPTKDNNNYLYAINMEWLLKAKMFLEPIIKLKNNIEIENSFDIDLVYNNYFDIKNNSDIKKKSNYSIYPGPINNFCITLFKDHWIDYNNLDENDFIKKGLTLNDNYVLVNSKDWESLKSIFDCTNEIRRKKSNLDLVKIKFILFDRRLQKDKHVVQVKEKSIQINRNSSIKQLKNKIINCVNEYLKKSGDKPKKRKQDILFYIMNKDKTNILVEMVYAFKIGIELYESLYIENLYFEDSSNLNHFFEKYDKNKHILIIELISPNTLNFLIEIKKIDNKYKCMRCNKEINNINEKYNCDLCNYSLFCSKRCANYYNDISHKSLDKELNKLIELKFNLTDLLNFNFYSILYKGTNLGKAGLNNLGGTSYMNSVLQCLSKTLDLTKYFLRENYLKEINSVNRTGTKGEISKQYYKLLYQMFNENDDYISPEELRQAFIKKSYKFNNNEIQDSHEFLLFFLDILHEDLNRVTIKKYKEINEQEKEEKDEEISNKWWNYNKSRDDSIIRDLFQGQYKSVYECTTCNYKSIKYDTFLTIGVPIPTEKIQYKIKFFTNNNKYNILNFNAESTIKDIILKSLNYIEKDNYIKCLNDIKIGNNIFNYNARKVPINILYNNIQIIEFNKKHLMTKIYNTSYNNQINSNDCQNNPSFDETRYKEFINKLNNSEIVLYEKDINSLNENNIDIFVYPIAEIEKENQLFTNSNKDKILSYPLIISINKSYCLNDLESLIYKKVQRIMHDQAQNQAFTIEICYPHFKDKWGEFKINEGKCPICGKVYEKKQKYCSLFPTIDKNLKISEFIEEKNKGRPLILFAKSLLYDMSKTLYKGMKLFFDKKNDIEIESKINLSLYDALVALNKGQILDEENSWYCKKCKELKTARKKLEIYRAPLYLIIQLKRFKFKYNDKLGGNVLGNKNETFIEYNELLNLKDFIIGPDKDKYEYYLYGVVIHKKQMNNGHYISYCKSIGKWYLFNDRNVERIESPINKDAYLLFYRRKNIE